MPCRGHFPFKRDESLRRIQAEAGSAEVSFAKVVPGPGPGQELQALARALAGNARVGQIRSGTIIYRARTYFDRPIPHMAAELGPPGVDRAGQGRMSAAGIPVFYGAMSSAVAAVEAYDRSPFVTVGRFETTRDLTAVDLQAPSQVDSGETGEFLRSFAREIVKPVKRDGREHYEYAPTQVLTEYLRVQLGAEAVTYDSALVAGGTNITIFAGPEACADAGAEARKLLVLTGAVNYRYGGVQLEPLSEVFRDR